MEVGVTGVDRGTENDERGHSDLKLQYTTRWTANRVVGHKAPRN